MLGGYNEIGCILYVEIFDAEAKTVSIFHNENGNEVALSPDALCLCIVNIDMDIITITGET